MWPEIIYKEESTIYQESAAEDEKYQELFTNPVAEGLYTDIRRLNKLIEFSDGII